MSAYKRAIEAVRERDHIRKSVGVQASFEELIDVYDAALRREGWRMMPSEPTEAILTTMCQDNPCTVTRHEMRQLWHRIWRAAPSPHDKEGEQ